MHDTEDRQVKERNYDVSVSKGCDAPSAPCLQGKKALHSPFAFFRHARCYFSADPTERIFTLLSSVPQFTALATRQAPGGYRRTMGWGRSDAIASWESVKAALEAFHKIIEQKQYAKAKTCRGKHSIKY